LADRYCDKLAALHIKSCSVDAPCQYVAGVLHAGTDDLTLQLTFGIGLWRFAGRLASAMVPDGTGPVRITAKAQELLIIGFTLIGALLLSEGIPDVFRFIVRLFTEAWGRDATLGEVIRSRILPSEKYQTGAAVAQIVIGIGLLLRPCELVGFISSRRAPTQTGTGQTEG